MKNEKVVLITGCSTGIGRELCKTLYDTGYTVVATARNVDDLIDVPAALRLSLDVTRKESIEAAVKQIISQFRKIDILVNNAGFSLRGALEEIDASKVKSMFEVNVFGIINMIQAVVPQMRKNKCGKILNIGSISGKFAQPVNGAYCASKHAVEALSDALRLELYKESIQVTVIEPGPIKTNFFKTLAKNSNEVMSNTKSQYFRFYNSDSQKRGKIKLTDVDTAAEIIAHIISKNKIKARYKVAVPFGFKVLSHLPDSIREYALRKR